MPRLISVGLELKDVTRRLLQEESAAAASNTSLRQVLTAREFVVEGLELEEKQSVASLFLMLSPRLMILYRRSLAYNVKQSSLDEDKLRKSRSRLFKDISTWKSAQDIHMPELASLPNVPDIAADVEEAEVLILGLPSAHASLSHDSLLDYEERLRMAQANDSIVQLRRHLRLRFRLFSFKKLQVDGTGNAANTRMRAVLHSHQKKIALCTQRYRVARLALLSIRPGSHEDTFPALAEEDVSGPFPDRIENPNASEGRFLPSWIWLRMQGEGDAEDGAALRNEWLRLRSRYMRWEEEQDLLVEEMRRSLRFLRWKADWWAKLGETVVENECLQSGLNAYAAKQKSMYLSLASSFSAEWTPLLSHMHSTL